ncbi:unnamed protein product [Periconia digitata]|uniref:CCHC-type domain-containing protein n=1 Tax=Periconia digitata TaxID=1303443 RepID=A0A9W4XUB0_9PLEO|nr:unnamed protein product [Periconia digitata]
MGPAQASPEAELVRKPPLTPAQLAQLKNSPKINILIGTVGNPIIAVEGVPRAILCYYSGYAEKQLASKNNLLIENGHKTIIQWICQWMAAGENDTSSHLKLAKLTVPGLCDLHAQAKQLAYGGLMFRVQDELRVCIGSNLLSKAAIHKLYTTVPELATLCLARIISITLQPRSMDYGPYMELAEENSAFSEDLEHGVKATLGQRARQWRNSKARAARVTRSRLLCYDCQTLGHIAKDCPSKPKRKRGENRRDRNSEYVEYDVVEPVANGGGIRTCTRVVKSGEVTRTGLII